MIVGPRYNDVDPAVEAAYERETEAEAATRLDAIAARLEARRALPCEVCDDGEECACCAVDREFADVLAVVREVAALAEEWRYKGEFGWGAWQEGEGPDPEGWALDLAAGKIRDALAPLTEEETDRG